MKINVDIGPNKKTIICLLKKKHDVVKFFFKITIIIKKTKKQTNIDHKYVLSLIYI